MDRDYLVGARSELDLERWWISSHRRRERKGQVMGAGLSDNSHIKYIYTNPFYRDNRNITFLSLTESTEPRNSFFIFISLILTYLGRHLTCTYFM